MKTKMNCFDLLHNVIGSWSTITFDLTVYDRNGDEVCNTVIDTDDVHFEPDDLKEFRFVALKPGKPYELIIYGVSHINRVRA